MNLLSIASRVASRWYSDEVMARLAGDEDTSDSPSANLVAVQLEANHANTDGSAWYAYFSGDVGEDFVDDALINEIEDSVKGSGVPLGIEIEDFEEVPSELSKYAGLKRYYVGQGI
jgi:hypothetical protein